MTTAVKERPILFSTPMVRAILDGKKTVTRRLVKLPVIDKDFGCELAGCNPAGSTRDAHRHCPFGMPGDYLWVRETWCHKYENGCMVYNDGELDETCVWYRASNPDVEAVDGDGFHRYNSRGDAASPWSSSIHMPRWASRITLEITSVRVERLHDIGKDGRKAADVLAEGISQEQIEAERKWFHPYDAPAIAFSLIWEAINGKRAGCAWKDNPWVWRIEFRSL